MPAARPQMEEERPWNRALLIAARSRQLDWNRFFHHRIRRRQATPASNIDAGGLGKTVRDDEGFRSTPALPKNSSATACMASSRLGATSLHGQDRPLAHARGIARWTLRFSPLPWASN